MKFALISTFILCLLFTRSFTQDQVVIDSLLTILELSKIDTQKINILNELAYEWKFSERDSARIYAQKAYALADAIGDISRKASSIMRLGTIDMIEGDYEKADSLFQLALSLRLKLGNKAQVASTYNNLGLISYYQGDDPTAVKFYLLGLESLAGEKNTKEEAILCNNLGESYMFLGKYGEAIKFINRGISVREELGDHLGTANSLLNLGNWYNEMGRFEKAIEAINASLEIFKKEKDDNGQAKCYINMGNIFYTLGEYEKALNFFKTALDLKAFLEPTDIASIYRSKGDIFKSTNKPKEAMEAFTFSLKEFAKLGNATGIASSLYNIGVIHKHNADFKTALTYFKDSQTILDTIYNPILSMLLTEELSETYAELNLSELAFQYSKQHNLLQDSLNENYRTAMNYKIELEEEKKKIAVLEKEKQLQLLEANRKDLVIKGLIVGAILWLLLSVTTLIAYLNRRKRRLAEQNLSEVYLEIDDLLKEQQLKTTYAKLEGQDEERTRIAQDLHDRVGSILSTVMLYFKGFDSKLELITANQNQLLKANELLDKAVVEVRKIAQDIHSGTLTKFGLKAELEALAEILKDSNHIKAKVVTHGLEIRLPVAIEIKIYRIIQELISNVLKHAKASEIVIQVNQFKDVLNVLVEDNGNGFNTELVKKKNTMGLKNVKSRVYDLHGSVIIDLGEGRGTTIAIDIPLES